MKLKAVIIEDEPRAATRLQKMLHLLEPELEIVTTLETVSESISFFKGNPQLDLVFSDIQLADDISFKIFSEVAVDAPIIFTTAYDAYAIDAFKTNGIDYLLKPINEADLQQALAKFKKLVGKGATPQVDVTALTNLLKHQTAMKPEYKKRFMVKVGTHLKSILVEDVYALYSKDKSTYLFTKQNRSYPIDQTLDALEGSLDPNLFFRVNRGFIVAMHANPDIIAYSNSRLKLDIQGLEGELIIVARDRTKSFKEWLGA